MNKLSKLALTVGGLAVAFTPFKTITNIADSLPSLDKKPGVSLVQRDNLTQVVIKTGVQVKYWDPMCDEKGSYGGYAPSEKVMILCIDNHKGDMAELGDTLRHEAIHVAQTCNGNGTPKPILSWNEIAKYSNNRILSIVQRYKPEHQHLEYEAFTGAAILSNNQVAKIVSDYCF